MSWFGNGTFKQEVLDSLEESLVGYDGTRFDAIAEILVVVSHIMGRVSHKDELLAKAYESAKAAAKAELMAKINT